MDKGGVIEREKGVVGGRMSGKRVCQGVGVKGRCGCGMLRGLRQVGIKWASGY